MARAMRMTRYNDQQKREEKLVARCFNERRAEAYARKRLLEEQYKTAAGARL